MDILYSFSWFELLLTAVLFVWTGFVRTGLGFGGAALGLPLLLFVYDEPIYWLPVIGTHLLFFSGMTLRTRMANVDYAYLRKTAVIIVPFSLVGVFGLIKLPSEWLVLFIYSVSLFYGVLWLLGRAVSSSNMWLDRVLLAVGGYVAGVSLTGAPLMVAVFMRNVSTAMLRNTLFVLWFSIVSIKMLTFIALGVDVHFLAALCLIPIAYIGHLLGLRTHDYIMANDVLFRRTVGGGLALVSTLGLLKQWLS